MKKIKPLSILAYVFLSTILLLMVLRVFFMGHYIVTAGSMRETLHHGDYILSWKMVSVEDSHKGTPLFYSPLKRGDIVVFELPGQREMLIKRIIGLPGETIEMTKESVVVNNCVLEEAYVSGETTYNEGFYHIPEGKIFVLGDNRKYSRDSREFGFLDIEYVRGKIFLIYFPFQRFRWLLH
ncbi:MAG: signal peptidase I [Spirochaetales bacterium]|nr:signal peptidase I [Spirochaetales bacterium]